MSRETAVTPSPTWHQQTQDERRASSDVVLEFVKPGTSDNVCQLKNRKEARLHVSWVESRAVFETAYFTGSTHWLGQKVVCSMLYVKISKICSMPKISRCILIRKKNSSMHLTSLPHLPCHNQSWALVDKVLWKKQKQKQKNLAVTVSLCEMHSE